MTLVTDTNGISNIQPYYVALLGMILGLGLLGTGLEYIICYYIVNQLGAVVASTVTYISLVVSLFMGVIIANETVGLMKWIIMIIILFGVFILDKKAKKILSCYKEDRNIYKNKFLSNHVFIKPFY